MSTYCNDGNGDKISGDIMKMTEKKKSSISESCLDKLLWMREVLLWIVYLSYMTGN